MPYPYTPDAIEAVGMANELTSGQGAIVGGLINLLADQADSGEWAVGSKTKTTSATTLVITHGLTGAPDFVLLSEPWNKATAATHTVVVNSTSVTVTLTTAQATWSVSYILGYTA